MRKILIVEDNQILLTLMRVVMEREGFDVAACLSGKEAVRLIPKEAFDVFIIDIMLPYLNGFEIIDVIKKSATNEHAKIIILSSLDDDEHIKDGFEIGADTILKKPISPKELVAQVEHLLNRQR